MDEAEKYQQRLQAIAERRQRQEEEERLAREKEEKRLKTAQEKRKHLREQWLSEAPPVPDEPATGERTKSQKTPEGEEAAEGRSEERAFREENKESGNRTAAARTNGQASTDKEEQEVNKEAEDLFSKQMAQSREEGRSVLGMLAVQVEKDPKTGTTVIRSVAPVSTPAAAPTATTVFDDGRKSIHAVGGSGSQLSTEELGQILSIVDGVGMTVLLDEFQAEGESVDAGRAPEGQVVSFSTRRAALKEDGAQFNHSQGDDLEAEVGIEERFTSVGHEEDKKEDRSTQAVGDIAGEVDNVDDLRLKEGPVTLVFLGYADSDQGDSREDQGVMLTAEHVIITEDGEEHVLGPQESASPQQGKDSQVFQDVPLDENEAGVEEVRKEENDNGWQNSSSPSKATSKRKNCKCCSVM